MKKPGEINSSEINKAVALTYEGRDAPKVVAKGKGEIAGQIEQLALENQVPIYEDPQLAALLEQLPLGDEIPESLYLVVAEVLIFVYSLDDIEKRLLQGQ